MCVFLHVCWLVLGGWGTGAKCFSGTPVTAIGHFCHATIRSIEAILLFSLVLKNFSECVCGGLFVYEWKMTSAVKRLKYLIAINRIYVIVNSK